MRITGYRFVATDCRERRACVAASAEPERNVQYHNSTVEDFVWLDTNVSKLQLYADVLSRRTITITDITVPPVLKTHRHGDTLSQGYHCSLKSIHSGLLQHHQLHVKDKI